MLVKSIKRLNKVEPVFDITVDGSHSYCLENGVVCHNSGGLYSASSILTLSKAKDKAKDGSISGAIITVTATKSRLTKENIKIKCLIKYNGGLDRYYGLLPIAEAAGIFKKVSTKYQLPDGTTVFGTRILKDPEKFYTAEVLQRIEEYVNVNFCYGGTENDGEVGEYLGSDEDPNGDEETVGDDGFDGEEIIDFEDVD